MSGLKCKDCLNWKHNGRRGNGGSCPHKGVVGGMKPVAGCGKFEAKK